MKAKDNDLEYRTTPRGMLYWATEFFEAYKIIQKEKGHFLALYQVKFYLLCHTIELLLKAYLLMKGYTVREIRSKAIGHNLIKLTNMVIDKEEVKISSEAYTLLAKVNAYYELKKFEYFERGYKDLLNIVDLEKEYLILIAQIKPLIQKDYLAKRRMQGS